MSTHDYDIANAAGATVRSDINNALAAIVTWNSNATAPATTFARMRWVDTTSGTIKRRNAANSAWLIESTDDETRVVARPSNTILDESDIGKTIVATGSFTQTFTAAATLGDGWYIHYRNDGVGTITLDPNGAETIDGSTTIAVSPGSSLTIVCDGANFKTIGKVSLATQAEQEAGSATNALVASSSQQFHPSACKGWAKADFAGAAAASYNVTSITDVSAGRITVTWATDFSGVHYAIDATVQGDPAGTAATTFTAQVFNTGTTAGAVDVIAIRHSDFTGADANYLHVFAFGDQ